MRRQRLGAIAAQQAHRQHTNRTAEIGVSDGSVAGRRIRALLRHVGGHRNHGQLFGAQHDVGGALALVVVNGQMAQRALSPTSLHLRRQHDGFAQKAGNVGITRAQVQLGRPPGLHQLAGAHHGHLVGKRQCFGLVVRHQDGGDAGVAQQTRHRLARAGAQAGIQRRKRLVKQHQARPLGERAGQRHALLLAARDFVRPALEHGGVQRHHVHQLGNAFVAPRRAARQSKADVIGHRQVRKQRAVLRHKTNAALVRGNKGGAIGQHLTAQRETAGIGRLKAGNQAQQRRLARARRPDDGGAAARRHVQVNAPQHLQRAIVFAHGAQFKAGHRPALRLDWV